MANMHFNDPHLTHFTGKTICYVPHASGAGRSVHPCILQHSYVRNIDSLLIILSNTKLLRFYITVNVH